MFTLLCPRCQKNSYSSDEKSFHACPYCGFRFSGKYGPTRRSEDRVNREIPFRFFYQEQHFEASARDFSEKGLSIKIFDDPPVTVGDILDLSIGDIRIRAEVMWVKKLPHESMVGLQRLN